MEISLFSWMLIIISAIFIGMGKSGIPGAGMVAIPIFASIFDPRMSVGLLLPILIFADSIAVFYYKSHTQWKYLLKLFPWAAIGLVLALIVGKNIDNQQFGYLLSAIIIFGVIIIIWQESKGQSIKIPDYWWFSALMGILGGFTSMIGNAAGPILALYLLSMRLPKNEFIGTRAWFFLIINIVKLPFHIWSWETITIESFILDLKLFPVLVIGMVTGFLLIRRIKEKLFKRLMIVFTIISALVLFIK